MPISRGIMPETLEKDGIRLFTDEYDRVPPIYSKILKVKKSTGAFEDAFKVAMLGTFVLKPEGTPISYDQPVQGPRRRVTNATYALGVRFTEEMRDDEQYGIFEKVTRDLADSARDHKEVLAHGPFNFAFATTHYTTMDGAALCSTAHVQLKTGKSDVANELNPGVALSTNGLETMFIQIRKTDNDAGRPIRLSPKFLFIPVELEFVAARLLESTQTVGSADNDINTVSSNRLGISVVSSRYLTDVDNWFVLSNEHTVTWYDRKELMRDSYTDPHTKDYMQDARYRCSVAAWEWYGVNGSEV